MADLSIIIPGVNEFPQNLFTVNNLWCELRDRADFEVIYVDNFCRVVQDQGRPEDKGFSKMKELSKLHPWLKVFRYDKKLSHWQAKNFGIEQSSGHFLFFMDAHCILSRNSLFDMYSYYRDHWEQIHGSLHLPLSYMLDAPGRELIYKLKFDYQAGEVHYSFTRYPRPGNVLPVPCMSTCGMMICRNILVDKMGGWPSELGIYGGGENFINFVLAILGYTVNVFPSGPLYHYADSRGYSWNHDDWVRNRIIASYMIDGNELPKNFVKYRKGNQQVLHKLLHTVIDNKACNDHRNLVKKSQAISIGEWHRQKNWEKPSSLPPCRG